MIFPYDINSDLYHYAALTLVAGRAAPGETMAIIPAGLP